MMYDPPATIFWRTRRFLCIHPSVAFAAALVCGLFSPITMLVYGVCLIAEARRNIGSMSGPIYLEQLWAGISFTLLGVLAGFVYYSGPVALVKYSGPDFFYTLWPNCLMAVICVMVAIVVAWDRYWAFVNEDED